MSQLFTLSFFTAFLAAAVRLAVPLIYAGLGETIAEKAGVINIGMEGVMLGGAFFSFAGAWYSGSLAVG
ncbi:MAG: ABC transporter permease, partial [Lachnospiraceae bacterium]|nr:ABC transporter permease [Lachnospiraceae bacterium]